jgi:hypothetical protein
MGVSGFVLSFISSNRSVSCATQMEEEKIRVKRIKVNLDGFLKEKKIAHLNNQAKKSQKITHILYNKEKD